MLLTDTPNEAAAIQSAIEVINYLGLDSFDKLDLPIICWAYNLLVREDVIYGADAWLVHAGQVGVARVRESIPYEGQKRFAIAHELGHWLLHKDITQAHLDGPEQLSDYKKSPIDIEANAFAAELLMPRDLFLAQFNDNTLDLKEIYALASHIGVGPTAALMRLLKLSRANAVMVAHKDGIANWYVRADGCQLPGVLPRSPVPTELEQLAKPDSFTDRLCTLNDWSPQAHENWTMREQTYWVPEGPAITLLTAD